MHLKERRALKKQKKRQKKHLRTAQRLLHPKSAKEYFDRGIFFTRAKQYESALNDFNHAIVLSPKYAKAYHSRGIIYQNIKQYENALCDFNQAIALNPSFAEAYNNRGIIYFKQKQYETALNDYNQAIALNPHFTAAYLNRALVYFEQKNYIAAQTNFDNMLQSQDLVNQMFDEATNHLEQLEKSDLEKFFNELDEYESQYQIDDKKGHLKFFDKIGEIIHQLQATKYQLEIELQVKNEESKRFKYLSGMATAVAHEINQPVGIIRAATSAALSDIQDDLFQPTELEPLLNKIYAQTERLKKIIESFRSFARGDRQHREIVNLNQVVTQTLDIFRTQFNHHNIALMATLEAMLPTPMAWANPFQLEEVLINLLTNAKDVLEGTDHPQIEIKTWRKLTGETGIQVEDNGPGIAPEFLEKLFLPFESTKPTERGTGLGLHLSRKIIEALGGTLNYTPRQGGVHRFRSRFPRFHNQRN